MKKSVMSSLSFNLVQSIHFWTSEIQEDNCNVFPTEILPIEEAVFEMKSLAVHFLNVYCKSFLKEL